MLDRRRLMLALGGAAVNHTSRAQPTGQPGQPTRFSTAPLGKVQPGSWRYQTLPKVQHSNDVAIVADDGHVLHGVSRASASFWATALDLYPIITPVLRWSWRVQRSLPVSDFKKQSGDGYAARVCVFFYMPTERLKFDVRLRHAVAQPLGPQPLPTASISYVWGGPQQAVGISSWNPYTEAVRIIAVDSGDNHAGRWRSVQRYLRLDWHNAFGGPAPRISGLAVGLDTNDSEGEAQAWFADITLGAE